MRKYKKQKSVKDKANSDKSKAEKKKVDDKAIEEEKKKKSLEEIREVFRKQQEEFLERQKEELEKILDKVSGEPDSAEAIPEIVIDGGEEEAKEKDAKIEALSSLVEKLQTQLVEVLEKQDSAEEELASRLNQHVQAVNNKLDAPRENEFKYKSSMEAASRIEAVTEILVELQGQVKKEVRGWERTKSSELLEREIQTLAEQEEDIRIAEESPVGFQLLEAYKNKSVGFRFVSNPEKALELKKIEQELLKERKDVEGPGKGRVVASWIPEKAKRGRSFSRSRSRSCSRSRRSRSRGRRSRS